MDSYILNNNNILLTLILEEEEEEDTTIVANSLPENRKPIDKMFKLRDSEGFYEILINRHLKNNDIKFREFFRINYQQFDFLLSLIQNQLILQPTNRVKKPITPAEKLAVTLRYLATGESIRSLSFSFRISHCYLSSIIKNTLAALKIKLMPIFIPDINNIEFKQKAAEFSYKWNFPNCILAIDGKHIRIRSPNNTGSLFHNYKDYFSLVLLAMVDANYKFVAVDIGSFGKEGDSGIFLKSNMGKQILDGTFGFPEQCNLPGSDKVAPHVIVGDEAFRLHKHIMKPYTRKSARENPAEFIFNYRLSRARRVTENAFGLLSQIFRIFYQHINLEVTTIDDLVWVACCLHNMLREGYMEKNKRPFFDHNTEQSPPINNMIPLTRRGGFSNTESFEVREVFKTFFNNEGALPWQPNS